MKRQRRRAGRRGALAFALAAALVPAGADAQAPEPYHDPPFSCEVIDYGTAPPPLPAPPDDPLCVRYDKTNITVSTLEVVDFLAAEPGRVAIVAGKCSYWQQDHWIIRLTPTTTPIVEWEGSYWYDGRTGTAAGIARQMRVFGRPADGEAFADALRPLIGDEAADDLRAFAAEGGGGGLSFAMPAGFGDACGGATESAPAALVTVHPDRPVRPLNPDLVGFGWHEGGAPLSTIAPLRPHLVRVDADLGRVSTGPGEALQLGPLLERVAAIRAIGGEPLVILAYLPAWLGQPVAAGRDPTRVRPADLDAWQQVVHDVVLALATAPQPAMRFEAWNEPDIPIFWQDTPLAWVDTVERSGRAIADVERETGIDLAFGGPATVVPDPIYLLPFLARFRDPALPLDFVSWHYYGNYPFFGPDGAEFPVTEPIQPLLGRPNPVASPDVFAPQVAFVRGLSDAALAGSGRATPDLVIDEWNLSAAGFDRRHDSADGAAFAASVLAVLQASGLDAAAYFMATDTRGVPGEHGAVATDGTPKPAWWTFSLWRRMGPTEVAVDAPASALTGLWAVATADAGTVRVLLASFRADGGDATRTIGVRIPALPADAVTATVRRIDGDHHGADDPEPVTVDGDVLRVALPTPGVALVEVAAPGVAPLAHAAGPGPAADTRLPATGAGAGPGAVALLLATLLGWRAARRPEDDGGDPGVNARGRRRAHRPTGP